MGKEIEHKYLVTSDEYKNLSSKCFVITQGYLSKDPERTVRVRIIDEKSFITIKSKNIGDTRSEFEYEIPIHDATELIKLCIGEPLRKNRWIVYYDGFKWEIDEFLNRDVPDTAEIELDSSSQPYSLPMFIGENITGKQEYYNSNL